LVAQITSMIKLAQNTIALTDGTLITSLF